MGRISPSPSAVPPGAPSQGRGFPAAGEYRASVDLTALADGNLNYLLRTPRPALDYACRFGNFLSCCPPHPGGDDPIANGDSDCRMDWEYAFMREMTGRADGLEVDAGVRRRVLSYLDDAGRALADGGIYCGGEPRAGERYISTWTGGKILYALAETYARTGDTDARALAGRVFAQLRRLLTVRDGRACYDGGAGPYRDGRWHETFLTCNYGVASEYFLHYARCCDDAEAWELAAAFARGSAAGMQANLGDRRIGADGSFADHTHLHTHELWGVADVALTLGDRPLLDWAKNVYAFVRGRGGDSGFFPERMILPGTRCWDGMHDRAAVSETCIAGDMVQTALCLARAGAPDYFDHAERYVRNYLRAARFRVTPALESWYRARHAERAPADVEAGLEMLRRDYDGAFLGHVAMTDWLHDAPSIPQLAMVGCCVPEGMRAIHAVWRAAAELSGGELTVNMGFDRDLPAAVIRSPDEGTLRLDVRRELTALRLRPPAWANPSELRLRVDGRALSAEAIAQRLVDGYVALEHPRAGTQVTLAWAVPSFTQEIDFGGDVAAPRRAAFHWRGNAIVGAAVDGAARAFPMYAPLADRPALLPGDLR